MKVEKLKDIIKEATREVIREELKEILLEAVKKPSMVVSENKLPSSPSFSPNQQSARSDIRSSYKDILGETAQTMTTNNLQGTFTPQPGMDPANGTLPSGQVSLDQISGLLNN